MHFTAVFSFIVALNAYDIHRAQHFSLPIKVHAELSNQRLDKLASKYSMFWLEWEGFEANTVEILLILSAGQTADCVAA